MASHQSRRLLGLPPTDFGMYTDEGNWLLEDLVEWVRDNEARDIQVSHAEFEQQCMATLDALQEQHLTEYSDTAVRACLHNELCAASSDDIGDTLYQIWENCDLQTI